MAALPSALRKLLENAILAARIEAETGARHALEALAVHLKDAHGSMHAEQRELRNRLRAHGRQLGDTRDARSGTQVIGRLVREMAYEHWHRMLFARFLAENGLLIEPTHGVPVTLAECQDLAREGGSDPWQLAARFAQRMLPAIFRVDDPALAVGLPPESRQALERLLAELPSAVFTADDSLGWTYQFWQAAEKDAVNARVRSGEKITGETLPAVTQLFTEHYMVLFLLHNTLGSWHAGKVLAARPEIAAAATSEVELRFAMALDGCDWEYLRFVREANEGDEEGTPTKHWRPAAGMFSSWPNRAADLKVLDPCCGSGHFLVSAFDILVRLRMTEEGLGLQDAIHAVLSDNLSGLELDPRCTQIAAFNLALAAWKLIGKPIDLPPLQLACCGLGPGASKAEWLQLAEAAATAGGMPVKRDLFRKDESLLSNAMRAGLEALHDLFSQAPELGSLIDPTSLPETLFNANFQALEPLLAKVFGADDDETRERAVAASGMARAAHIMVGPEGGYALVLTNVPYLGRGSQAEELKAWIDANHKDAKNDLATVFVSRMLRWVGRAGTVAAVTPQNWLFLTGYSRLRTRLLQEKTWNAIVRLGAGAFETVGGRVVNVALVLLSGGVPGEGHTIAGIDVSTAPLPSIKAALLRGELRDCALTSEAGNECIVANPDSTVGTQTQAGSKSADPAVQAIIANVPTHVISQAKQLENPDARVTFDVITGALLEIVASNHAGLLTGDTPRFRRAHWEVCVLAPRWCAEQSTAAASQHFTGCDGILLWDNGEGELRQFGRAMIEVLHDVDRRGREAWGKQGIGISQMSDLPSVRYLGCKFDTNLAVLIPKRSSDLAALWVFCSSPEFERAVRRIDQKLNVTNATLGKVPFDLSYWRGIADERFSDGLPEPQSNDPTQWLFHGHPAGMLASGRTARSPFGIPDAIGVERPVSLICREPNPRDALQVSVARVLGYRWPAEHDDAMCLDVAARDWVAKCADLDRVADEDGIVCLPSIRGEPALVERVRRMLAAAFAGVPGGFSAARERELLVATASDGRPADSLDEWLREQFFEQHCVLFHHRPFIWHIWDGRPDGFGALVNYHRLAASDGEGRRVLESLAFTYLGEWIDRQRAEQTQSREGADARLAAAMHLQGELKKILEGEPPYDLFVRWKPLHEQTLGWEPDIDDGVRLNIRPFLKAKDMGRRGSGLLRVRPKSIKWKKDRGKEPESLRPRHQFPWFWGCEPEEKPEHRTNFGAALPDSPHAGSDFDGARWNDLHYTRAAKEAARAAVQPGAPA